MTREEILAKATPRPWIRHLSHFYNSTGTEVIGQIEGPNLDARMELVLLAVNSYEKQRECISGLITEARQVVNTFWETYEYRDKYTDNDCTKALEHLETALARAEELLK